MSYKTNVLSWTKKVEYEQTPVFVRVFNFPEIKSSLVRYFVNRFKIDKYMEKLWTKLSDRWTVQSMTFVTKQKTIEDEKVCNVICKAINALHLHPEDVECVFIGPEQFMGCKDEFFDRQLTMECPPIGFNSYTYCNIPLRYIPWFDGILVVRKEK